MHPPWRVHSLALYFTQDRFSPSSSKLLIWLWFLCFVWRPWIPFNQNLLVAACLLCPPSFRFYGSSIPTGINCIKDKYVIHFVVHVYIDFSVMLILSVPHFASQQLQSVSLSAGKPYVLAWMYACWSRSPPPGTSERKNQIGYRENIKEIANILNEIRRFEGGFSPLQHK